MIRRDVVWCGGVTWYGARCDVVLVLIRCDVDGRSPLDSMLELLLIVLGLAASIGFRLKIKISMLLRPKL